MADGTEFIIDVPVHADQAVGAASSIDALSRALEAASAKATAASQAMQAGQTAYAQAEAAANRASVAVERIGVAVAAQEGKLQKALEAGDTSSIESASTKLENLKARQAEAARVSEEAAGKLRTQADALDALKAAADGAANEEQQLAEQMKKAKAAAGTGKANEAAEGLAKLGGPLGMIGQKIFGVKAGWDKLKVTFGDSAPLIVGAVGIAAIAAAALALVGALAVGAARLAAFAISTADAARTSALLSQGIMGSVEGGLALDSAVNSLAKRVPIAADELKRMGGDLAKTGLKGDALTAALEEAAVKAATLKFGPQFAKQMLSLDQQTLKLKADIGKIFGGLKIEGFLEALAKVGKLFDEDSSSAKAIKVVFESFFQPLVDGLTAMLPKFIAAFLQMEIWILRGLIAVKPYGSTFMAIGQVIAVAIGTGVVVLGAFVAIVAAVTMSLVTMADSAMKMGAAVAGGAAYAVGFLMAKFQEAKDWLASMSLSDVGMAMIDGLTGGLISAGPKVLQAITGIANSAIQAAKKALGIASPSKVFATIGAQTAEGMETGVDAGSAGVSSALEGMVAPPDAAAPGAGGGGTSVSSSGPVYNITVNVDGAGGGNGDDLAAKIVEGIRNYLESVAGDTGGMVPA